MALRDKRPKCIGLSPRFRDRGPSPEGSLGLCQLGAKQAWAMSFLVLKVLGLLPNTPLTNTPMPEGESDGPGYRGALGALRRRHYKSLQSPTDFQANDN
ncbi:predicted protein [Aspergillus nidulans FGSC A4]|uniref:Uncharacterized protein n=1 Tax=Emericella nidulans (strain FGSC A4 / ATCC 38163 / CBS 112.46 / NRRL 194 / M139) TaxID=227321 RepID=Q5BC27_EMENI|nr:hypothetical protein [Aspergillus nidulans FGSC A4]EAA65068.1 predicted protein [Aspergillus nidulans FGSC A4]CBF85794.1 TPA: hypothetical protein ANIA_01903 [Aspergillus nidulans FGSC A4]|eukprot:XP_659507.1 predicted protein [Aspergillus nidulans FGSC A4]